MSNGIRQEPGEGLRGGEDWGREGPGNNVDDLEKGTRGSVPGLLTSKGLSLESNQECNAFQDEAVAWLHTKAKRYGRGMMLKSNHAADAVPETF